MKSDQLLFWKYVTPSIFGAVIGGSFAIVDTIFIGLAGGKNALAATAVRHSGFLSVPAERF